MYAGNRHGFTMIELLMVIMLVALLGSVALPQFLDFRQEARVASMKQNLTALRSAVRMQQTLIRLKCNQEYIAEIPNTALNANDIGALCTQLQVSGLERRFMANDTLRNEGTPLESVMPVNGLNDMNFVDQSTCVADDKCTCPPGPEAANAGWYINQHNEIWAADPVGCSH